MSCCQKNNTHIFESQEQYHRCAHMPFNSVFFRFQEKGQIVPNIRKHRSKQELETVPPQDLGTVPPKGSKK